MAFDTQSAWKLLADQVPLSVDQCAALLKQLERFQQGAAYLASCQAATTEGLSASTSKSQRQRHLAITRIAAEIMDGELLSIKCPTTIEAAKARCLRVVSEQEAKSEAIPSFRAKD